MGLACGPDNRAVDTDGGWRTRMNERCEVEWIPPPPLDTGQTRINYHHLPERLLNPPEEPARSETTGKAEPADPEPTAPEPAEATRTGEPGEPGGPAPPENQAA
ncbi:hypothetical protein [Mycolicibacterium hippocampi]|nr:hypothetical protein [Mycolicibacterium hippocampi]